MEDINKMMIHTAAAALALFDIIQSICPLYRRASYGLAMNESF